MKFLARLVLACVSTMVLMPSFLSASSDVAVVSHEISQCTTGVRCEQGDTGAWVCSITPSSLEATKNVVPVSTQTLGKQQVDLLFVGQTSALEYPTYSAKQANTRNISYTFAREYVGTIKIQV
ncbi:MAG: hypothetical protein ACOYN2_01115 [Patescibacteria group bacterium]